MSVHYVIDGYNLLKQIPHLTSKKLKTGREGLIQLIKKYRLTGSPKNKVIIVFDGREDVVVPRIKAEFEIIFSKGESADDKIKKIITSASNPSQLIVVSDDKELIFFTRNHRAISSSTREFLSKIVKKKKVASEAKPELPFSLADKITDELKEVWLRNKKQNE